MYMYTYIYIYNIYIYIQVITLDGVLARNLLLSLDLTTNSFLPPIEVLIKCNTTHNNKQRILILLILISTIITLTTTTNNHANDDDNMCVCCVCVICVCIYEVNIKEWFQFKGSTNFSRRTNWVQLKSLTEALQIYVHMLCYSISYIP